MTETHTRPPTINVAARLVPDVDTHAADLPGSWLISHGLGKPAANTYTEVAFADSALLGPNNGPWAEHIVEAAVREVAGQLYGTAYAFIYRPDQAEDSVHRYGLRRRERVFVSELEVWW